MKVRPAAVLCCLSVVAGCTPKEPPRPSRPPVPSEVSKIDTLELRTNPDVSPTVATQEYTSSPTVINALLAFLRDHPDGWTVSDEKLPKPQRTVTFYSGQIALLVLSVGEDWLGGRLPEYAAKESRKRPLAPAEKAELRRILDGPR